MKNMDKKYNSIIPWLQRYASEENGTVAICKCGIPFVRHPLWRHEECRECKIGEREREKRSQYSYKYNRSHPEQAKLWKENTVKTQTKRRRLHAASFEKVW